MSLHHRPHLYRHRLFPFAIFLVLITATCPLGAQCTLDCSAPELQDMAFSLRSRIPAARTDLVQVNPGASCTITNVTFVDTDNDGAGCTSDTLVVTRTYTATVTDNTGGMSTTVTLTCEQNFTIVNTTLSCGNQTNVSLDANCEAEITACMVLRDPRACCDSFTVMIGTCENIGIDCPAFPTNIVDGSQLGDTLFVKVIDPRSTITCWGRVLIEDKLDPSLTCGADTVSCTANTSPEAIGFPVPMGTIVTDNGDGTYQVAGSACDATTLSFSDRPGTTSCSTEFGQTIFRDWTAEDMAGNQFRCTDTIFVRQAGLSDIVMPPNFDGIDQPAIACNATFPMLPNGFPDTSFTGAPTGSACFNLLVNFTDEEANIFDVCGGTRKLIRRWTFMDWCAGIVADSFQVIKIEDAIDPTIVCPADMTISANDGGCTGSLTLPRPIITDECSGTYYIVSSPDGNLNQVDDSTFTLSDLATGQYIITYTALDSCGNSIDCPFNLTVEDQVAPQVVCDSVTVAPLGPDGVSRVLASAFDDGSFDDCNPIFFKVRRVTTGECSGLNGDDDPSTLTFEEWFDDTLKMCCDDVGQRVPIILRVYDVDPGTGPVNDDRHLMGGDLFGHFSDCTVSAQTQDGVPPTLMTPADATISCTTPYDINDLNSLNTAFGTATATDDCGNATLIQTATNTGTCPNDTITRTFTVSDAQGNQVSGSQTVIVQVNSVLTDISQIQFPGDQDLTDCNADPAIAGMPTYAVTPDCSLITATFDDDTTFSNNSGTCPYFILRTWSVLEVCPITLETISGPFVQPNAQRIDIDDSTVPNTSVVQGQNFVFDAQNNPNAVFTFSTRDLDTLGNNGVPRSSDACTPYEDLVFHFGIGNINDDTMTLSCADFLANGRLITNFRILDQCNNIRSIRNVSVSIANCGNNPQPIVAGGIVGHIETEAGEPIEDVFVQLSDQNGWTRNWETSSDGSYYFPDLLANQSYSIRPVKQVGARNGVSTYDLVMISKHITGQQPLPSPYQRIAADVNNSGDITTFDLVELRKVILYINTNFPMSDAWRFVEEDFVFPASDPFISTFPEVFEVDALQHPMDANFVAMKVGDVNGSARANSATPATPRSYAGSLELTVPQLELQAHHDYLVPIRSTDLQAIAGFEFALQFSPDQMEYLGMEPGQLPQLQANNIGTTKAGSGTLLVSWHQADPSTLDEEAVLFYLRFRARQQVQLSEALRINTSYTETEAYQVGVDQQLERLRVELLPPDQDQGFVLYQNQPNPFQKHTLISFHLPRATKAQLTLYDLGGKIVKRIEGQYGSGYNEITIQPTDLPGSGVFYYRLETPGHAAIKKMTLLK